jgi:hypothetical protein
MRCSIERSMHRKVGLVLCGFLMLALEAQTQEQGPAPILSSDQLDNLVAPIALYPDSLLAQVLAATTYPLEIVEAQQWLQQNSALTGRRLLDAARQQNWDPSVQALVAFPNVVTLLNREIRWTTDLGNAFLSQQADVMNAVQRMRERAKDDGRLGSTREQSVTSTTQEGQSTIEIQPANPQVIYVPSYNPNYVWGPPAGGAYPALGYPDAGYGLSFNPGVLIGAIFSGLLSFGGWGWGLNWLAHGLFLNNLFLGHFGFGGLGGGGPVGGGLGARTVWAHNPGHRLGVPYSNRMVASRFAQGGLNTGLANMRSYSPRSYSSRAYNEGYARPGAARDYNRSVDGSRYNSPAQSYRSSSTYRNSSPVARAPAARYSARMPSHESAPRSFKANRPSHTKAPHSSSHSSGGHSHKRK